MQTKHTPGPWKCGIMGKTVGVTVWRSDGEGINYSRICRNIKSGQDALLIAAAPDLLEACQAVLEWARTGQDHGGNPYFKPMVKLAQAALLKATGEAV